MGFYVGGDGGGGDGQDGEQDELAGLVEGLAFAGGEEVGKDEDQEAGDGRRRQHLDQALDRMAGLFGGDALGQRVEGVDVVLSYGGIFVDNEIVFGVDALDAGYATPGLAAQTLGFFRVDGQVGHDK